MIRALRRKFSILQNQRIVTGNVAEPLEYPPVLVELAP
jgi:hypothetical protein